MGTGPSSELQPGIRFAKRLRMLVAHRGVYAELELIERLTMDRLTQLYAGQEPHLSEFYEICEILNVPGSFFKISEEKEPRELELALVEVQALGASMNHQEQSELAYKIINTVGIPDSAIALLKSNP